MTSRFLTALLLACLACALSPPYPCAAADAPAAAAARSTAANPDKDDAWIVTLQGIGAVAPSFPGSSVARPYPFPGVSVRAVGEAERFSAPDDGYGVPVSTRMERDWVPSPISCFGAASATGCSACAPSA